MWASDCRWQVPETSPPPHSLVASRFSHSSASGAFFFFFFFFGSWLKRKKGGCNVLNLSRKSVKKKRRGQQKSIGHCKSRVVFNFLFVVSSCRVSMCFCGNLLFFTSLLVPCYVLERCVLVNFFFRSAAFD